MFFYFFLFWFVFKLSTGPPGLFRQGNVESLEPGWQPVWKPAQGQSVPTSASQCQPGPASASQCQPVPARQILFQIWTSAQVPASDSQKCLWAVLVHFQYNLKGKPSVKLTGNGSGLFWVVSIQFERKSLRQIVWECIGACLVCCQYNLKGNP